MNCGRKIYVMADTPISYDTLRTHVLSETLMIIKTAVARVEQTVESLF